MEGMDGPFRGRLDAQTRFHRRDTRLCILFARLQGRRRQSTGPGSGLPQSRSAVTHPATFAPEFINAYEAGTKNTLLDGSMTLNGDVFYYDYKGYQISQIVDRTSVNLNFNATVKGAELESTWEPIPGLRFNFAGGYENTRIDNGQQAIDLMDRTAGHSDWMLVRPFLTETSSCILPTYVVNEIISSHRAQNGGNNSTPASAVPANNIPGSNIGLYNYGDFTGLIIA